jgi:hypothetical protein
MMIPNPNSKRIRMYDYPYSGLKRIRIQTKVFMAKIDTKFCLTLNIFFSPKIAILVYILLDTWEVRSVKAYSPTESSSNMKFPRIFPDFVYHNGLPESGSG